LSGPLFEQPFCPDAPYSLYLQERTFDLRFTPLADAQQRTQGMLVFGRDISEIVQRTSQIEQERSHLNELVQQLETREQERDQFAATVQGLSLPIIPLEDGVLVLPLIGDFDHARQEELLAVLLPQIERSRARMVLIDLTGCR
jgi:rsbT co-antagonist protein RsbR